MAKFADHIEALIEREGGYRLTEHPNDRGGRTYAGVSERSNPTWSGWAVLDKSPQASPAEMRPHVHGLYKPEYWDRVGGDHIREDRAAEILFSSAVLSGPRTAVRLAQTVCNAGLAHPSLETDGFIGPRTIEAINREPLLIFELRFTLARIARYCAIVGRSPDQITFLRGWTVRALDEADL